MTYALPMRKQLSVALHLRQTAHKGNRIIMRFSKPYIGLILSLSVVLSGCGLVGNDWVACPPASVLATAERVQVGGGEAVLKSIEASCEKDTGAGLSFVEIEAIGVAPATETSVPVFVASLNAEGRIINRQQFMVDLSDGGFAEELPMLQYEDENKGQESDRLVVGFVLSKAQLQENRAAWRKSMGLK